ncbi:hypothetical protein E2C01_013623 [Portunus trituberculatus]|uniref:Uncharacterized protein n=1 Tax=Portunus trituberculatus TaxID=210409 RepID=A0A5B7DHT8_PORTR|nr:hypothetical protein [Portunus trituberculatus]
MDPDLNRVRFLVSASTPFSFLVPGAIFQGRSWTERAWITQPTLPPEVAPPTHQVPPFFMTRPRPPPVTLTTGTAAHSPLAVPSVTFPPTSSACPALLSPSSLAFSSAALLPSPSPPPASFFSFFPPSSFPET